MSTTRSSQLASPGAAAIGEHGRERRRRRQSRRDVDRRRQREAQFALLGTRMANT